MKELIAKLEAAKSARPKLWHEVVTYAATHDWVNLDTARHLRFVVDTAFGQPRDKNLLLAVALALVPEGWRVEKLEQRDPTLSPHSKDFARVRQHNKNNDGWANAGVTESEAATLILALCAAALKARLLLKPRNLPEDHEIPFS